MLNFENLNEIIKKYNLIVSNYSWFFFNNLKVYKNQKFSDYLYSRGLIIIYNIFNISLTYYDNLGDIYNICEKGYMYFIEFINQLNISVFNNSNMELTIKDAIMFCYKKTIFLLENKIVDTNISNKYLHSIVNKFTIIINNLFIIINENVHKKFSNINSNNTNTYVQYNTDNYLENNIKSDTILKNNIIIISKLFKKILSLTSSINDDLVVYLNNIIEFQNILIDIKEKYNYNNSQNYNNYLKYDYNNILLIIDKFISKKKYIIKFLEYNESIILEKLNGPQKDLLKIF